MITTRTAGLNSQEFVERIRSTLKTRELAEATEDEKLRFQKEKEYVELFNAGTYRYPSLLFNLPVIHDLTQETQLWIDVYTKFKLPSVLRMEGLKLANTTETVLAKNKVLNFFLLIKQIFAAKNRAVSLSASPQLEPEREEVAELTARCLITKDWRNLKRNTRLVGFVRDIAQHNSINLDRVTPSPEELKLADAWAGFDKPPTTIVELVQSKMKQVPATRGKRKATRTRKLVRDLHKDVGNDRQQGRDSG